MPTKNRPLSKILHRLHINAVDRSTAIADVARALDLITPFTLIPVIGSTIEMVTDLVWLPAATAIVDGFLRAKARAEDLSG